MPLLTEMLHEAATYDRERTLADALRHAHHDGVRRGVLTAWRDRRAAAHAAAPTPRPSRRRAVAPVSAPARA